MRTWQGVVLVMVLVVGGACSSGGEVAAEDALIVTEAEAADSQVRAALEHECIAAGNEQALTISVESGVGVQYTSTYADGETGREPPHGGGYGGAAQALSNEGMVEQSWTISEDAPVGLVVVYVSALLPGDAARGGPDEALTRLTLVYGLVGPDEECPAEGEPWPMSSSTVVTDTGDEHPDVRATLAHECMRAGGEQALTVRGKGGLTYNSLYANGENGRPRPSGGGYGGSGFGVPVDGVVEQSWTVEDDAPPGPVTVLVHASLPSDESANEGMDLELSYLLVGPEEECP